MNFANTKRFMEKLVADPDFKISFKENPKEILKDEAVGLNLEQIEEICSTPTKLFDQLGNPYADEFLKENIQKEIITF